MPETVKLDDYLKQLDIAIEDRSLLDLALTHRSYVHERWDTPLESNERLEFLGDSILNFLTARFLFLHEDFAAKNEGQLTALRAALVRTSTLARFARHLELGTALKVGRGEEQSGGRDREPLLADAFEAVLAAIFLLSGEDTANQLLLSFLQPEVERITREGMILDEKSQLQERIQGERNLTPRYQTIREAGPDHERRFTVEVWAGDERLGIGEGQSKQAAQQAAAQAALRSLNSARVAQPSSLSVDEHLDTARSDG